MDADRWSTGKQGLSPCAEVKQSPKVIAVKESCKADWKEVKEVISQVFTGNSMSSMVESMKMCFSVSNWNMREDGAGSRLKTLGRSQLFDMNGRGRQ